MLKEDWIGVDLDGTLAMYDTFISLDHIGEPILPMVERVRRWIEQGHRIKIFTARISCDEDQLQMVRSSIESWCLVNIGQVLEITNVKDLYMEELWDDRAVQVIKNTGNYYGHSTRGLK